MDKIPMQTLQIYKVKEKIPVEHHIKKIFNELESIKINFPRRNRRPISDPKARQIEEPKVKNIELQNTISNIENDLSGWIQDYRDLIETLCELDRILPKTEHILRESDEQAETLKNKIIKVEDIKEQTVTKFKYICLQHEENDLKLKRQIKQLNSQVLGLQSEIENLEYQLKRKDAH